VSARRCPRCGEPERWEPDVFDGYGCDCDAPPRYELIDGNGGQWLVQDVGRHNCGTGPSGHFGAHEPACGAEPVGRVVDLLATLAAVAELFAPGPNTSCRTVWQDGVECVTVPLADLRDALDPAGVVAPVTVREGREAS
jgi:hypothetical protein